MKVLATYGILDRVGLELSGLSPLHERIQHFDAGKAAELMVLHSIDAEALMVPNSATRVEDAEPRTVVAMLGSTVEW